MLTTGLLQRFITFSLLLLAFSLPFDQRISNFFIILFALLALIHLFTNSSSIQRQRLQQYTVLSLIYLPLLLFLFRGDPLAFDLNQKTPLLVFPLLSFLAIDKELLKKIHYSFIIGTGVALSICLLNLLLSLLLGKGMSTNMSFTNVIGIHPSYLSLFILYSMGFLILQEAPKKNYRNIFLISFIALVGVLLLASRLLLLLYPLVLFLSLKSFIPKKVSWSIIGIVIIAVSVLGYGRLKSLQDFQTTAIGTTKESGINQRMLFWKLSTTAIQENLWLGSGIGKEEETLAKQFDAMAKTSTRPSEENALKAFSYNNINVHNQFLQTLLGAGIVGLLFLLWIFIYPGLLKQIDTQYLIFLCLLAFIFLTESFLETHRGIIFYGLINTLCFLSSPSRK